MDSFGERLVHTRKAKNISQKDLAEAMQKSGKAVISSWEVGRAEPSLSDLKKLAEVLGTTACWLLDGIDTNNPDVMREPPAGFILVPATEYVDMQRQIIEMQKGQLGKQQGQLSAGN